MGRKLLFLITILIGAGVGLYYGWGFKPTMQSTSPLKSLRQDYKADYVLMVAEVYDRDGDLKLAIDRLDQLKSGSPLDVTTSMITYARSAGYSINDLELMSNLIQDLQGSTPTSPAVTP
jgi:hypothetical protein